MATFAEYPSQTMSSNNDFTLYPYQEVWNNDQGYLPTSTYPDQTYINPTTFDSYQTQQACVQPDQFSFGLDQSYHAKNHLQPSSPNYSPSNSASHSFDPQNPPVLSSTSDSGHSAQSTISSTMGSPSVQPQPSSDWNQPQGMSIFPGIVQSDSLGHDVFATTGFDLESISVTDKGCVGELTAFSSSQQSSIVSPFNFSSHPTSFDLLRDSGHFSQSSGVDKWSIASNALPTTNDDNSLPIQSALTPQPSGSLECMSPNDSIFKSPIAPASATSPVVERVKGKRRAPVAPPAPKRARGSSPLNQAMSYHESDLPARPQAPPPTFTSPFFTQSSGNFVPPLESSCPSPSSLFRLFSFLVSFATKRNEVWLTIDS